MRFRSILAALFIMCAALSSSPASPPASAQTFQRANPNDGMQGARNALQNLIPGSVFPGPRPGERRIVWVWRPQNAPANTPLPTLYMFDGRAGLQVALLRLKAAFDSGALAPILVVAPDPNPRNEGRG